MNSAIRKLLIRLEVDKAVFFGILTRIWQTCAGPVTAILIANRFSLELQGFYYTFWSLLALQVFVQLGLATVIVPFASHEWSKLEINKNGQVVGDKDALSRLVSIANIASKWYVAGSIIVTFGLGFGGYYFFSINPDLVKDVEWTMPWLSLSLLTGITICIVPVWSLLEGCNQVTNVYMYRFIEGIVRSIPIWIAILSGAKLWAPAISTMACLIWTVLFLRKRYWGFIKSLFFSRPTGPQIQWRTEMLPMQWRVAVSWISGYFMFSLFVPVLFQYHGPIVAGQMGMTWAIVSSLLSVFSVWVAPKFPYFGILIAEKKYEKLDRLFWRLVNIVGVGSIISAFLIWYAVFILHKMQFDWINRILPPLPTGLFLVATIIMSISVPFSNYLRAHKKEPIMIISVVSAILITTSNLTLGKYFSATGMAVGYLAVNLFVVPFIFLVWFRCRKKWHSTS